MKVEFNNTNTIISTPAKTAFKSKRNDVLAPVRAIENDETKYSQAVSIGAIAVLAGLGLTMLHKINTLDIAGRKILPQKAKQVSLPSAHGGPTIDITKGKTAIADAWNGYIDEIENRVQIEHAKIKNIYNQVFNKNAEQLDKYEAIVDEKLANNPDLSFVRCA